MIKDSKKSLLQDERVVREINQHKWLESEKAGYDIGFENAAEDWINRFSNSWEQNNSGEQRKKSSLKSSARMQR